MKAHFLALAWACTLALPAPAAAPRDEVLRLAPDDFALVAVVQNLRDHTTAVMESPFAAWFPTSALGKRFLNSADFKKITDATGPVFGALGITPTDLFHDILGDAVVFAYAPAPAGDPKGERSIILLRPRKPDTLAGVLDRLNTVQTNSKELKALVEHKHAGATYFERQKPEGPSDFYCFLGGCFAFSQSQAEIKGVIDRAARAPKDRPPVLVARMTKLGVADAAAVVLVNPRPLDRELTGKVKNAKPNERGFLVRFEEVWAATEALAFYIALDTGTELGVSVQFNPDKLPANLKGWLAGERVPSALWAAVPENALLAVAGRVKVADLLAFLDSLHAADGKQSVREMFEQTLGPLFGKDKLQAVLDALGPDWGLWLAPPSGRDSAVPVFVGALKVRTDGPKGAEATKALVQALEYGFQVARIAYNAKHKEQIELREEKDGNAVIKSLSGEAFPAGFRPCFALKDGYLLVSTSPDAIKAFRAPPEPKAGGAVPLARFSASGARAYLSTSAPQLAKWLSAAGVGEEKVLLEQLGALAAGLEPIDKVELLVRGDAAGMKLMLRTKTVKPLKN
jgi:hypothetical protein